MDIYLDRLEDRYEIKGNTAAYEIDNKIKIGPVYEVKDILRNLIEEAYSVVNSREWEGHSTKS